MTAPDYRAALTQPEPEFTDDEVDMIQAPWSYLTPPQPDPEGDRLFHWRNLGDGKPVQVQECLMCGMAPANVDDCGRFGDPACPCFGVGKPEPEVTP